MDDLFEHAMESERDKAINGFYTHFIVFLSVITGLAILNLVEGGSLWVQWVVLGWGAGIAFHAFQVLVKRPREEHKLRAMRIARAEKRAAEAQAEEADAHDEVTAPAEPVAASSDAEKS